MGVKPLWMYEGVVQVEYEVVVQRGLGFRVDWGLVTGRQYRSTLGCEVVMGEMTEINVRCEVVVGAEGLEFPMKGKGFWIRRLVTVCVILFRTLDMKCLGISEDHSYLWSMKQSCGGRSGLQRKV